MSSINIGSSGKFSGSQTQDVQVVRGDGNSTIRGDGNALNQGDNNQIAIGNANQLSRTEGPCSSSEKELSKSEVLSLVDRLGLLIKESDLPQEAKSEAVAYLIAAKKALDKEKIKQNAAIVNLESTAEIMETASTTLDAGATLWTKAKPIVTQIITWLSAIAAGSLLLG